jgi:hypothetical protein
MSFETYKVAVRISLISNVAAGLMGMSRQFGKVHGDAEKLNRQLDKIKLTMLQGGALFGVGAFGLNLISKTIAPAKEYTHQLALMNTVGMQHLEIVKATNAAWEATKVAPTSSVAENLAAVRELRMVFGDTQHAIDNMPTIQKLQAILKDVKGGSARDEAYEIAKALELKGATRKLTGDVESDVEIDKAIKASHMPLNAFIHQSDMMTKAIVASGGKVGATDFLGTFKYGRAATAGWSDAFAYTILPTLIQEMKSAGGSSGGMGGPGNALMSAYAAVVGGTVPQKALKVWDQLHMLDTSKVVWDKVGSAKGLAPGGIKGSEVFQANPYEWVQQYLVPALQKAGYLTEAQQKQAIQYLFPNRTAGFVMSQFVTQAWKFERDKKLISQAMGLSSYEQLLKTDPELAEQALHKQWNTLMGILGFQIMPVLISTTLKLISVLRSISGFFREHSILAKTLVIGFGALSAAMAFGGTVILLKGAFEGLSLMMGTFGVLTKVSGLTAAIGALMSPIGLAIAALGTLALTLYAFRDISQSEVDAVKTDGGAKLTSDALRRSQDMGWHPPTVGNPNIPEPRAGKSNQLIQLANRIVMPDGRVLADVVTEHQSREASRPYAGASGFDPSMGLAPVGLSYAP